MKDKYYTPSLEEFRIGFEYEEYINSIYDPDDNWVEGKCYANDFDIDDIDNQIISKNIRVKYLDINDIESLGFKVESDLEELPIRVIFTKDNIEIIFHVYSKDIVIYDRNNIRYDVKGYPIHYTYFNGTIKNISEFKLLLKQLNIE